MSNTIDKRRIVALQSQQEYAHQYEKPEDYQYYNEDKRVKYHVSDPDDVKTREELYNIQVESTQPQQSQSKIRVRLNNDEILEESRQRSYKIRNVPPVWDKSDPGQEAYLLSNDPREDELKYIQQSSTDFSNRINEENQTPISTPAGRTQIFQDSDCENELTEGLEVQHVEEGIKGKIAFVGKEKVAVVWEDNTRERFSINDAKKSLIAYVSTTQQQIAPLETPAFPKQDDAEINSIVDEALKALDSEDIPESKEASTNIDIEKIKLKRKVNELENQIKTQDIEKIKTKAAKELVDLMQKKGMLGTSEEETTKQFETIMAMDDIGFDSFQQAILSTKTTVSSVDDVLAVLEEDTYDDIEDGQEYAKAKELAKKASTPKRTVDGIEMGDTSFFENGGLASNFRPKVGGFGESTSSSSEQTETRNVSASQKQHKAIERKSSELDLSGFQGIQGIKQPINITANNIPTTGGKFQELFNTMNWTLLSK